MKKVLSVLLVAAAIAFAACGSNSSEEAECTTDSTMVVIDTIPMCDTIMVDVDTLVKE